LEKSPNGKEENGPPPPPKGSKKRKTHQRRKRERSNLKEIFRAEKSFRGAQMKRGDKKKANSGGGNQGEYRGL